MRYKATATVEGHIHLDRGISFQKKDLVFEFVVGQDNRLERITIWKDIIGKDIEKYRGEIYRKDGIIHINMGGDAELEEKIINEFRLLESNLSFISRGALKKIDWENVEEEFISQNEEEKQIVTVYSFKSSKGKYLRTKAKINERVLEHYVIEGQKYDELAIPKAFWREGFNHHKNGQYIQAFYNYYFIIEGFYANGKTGKKEVLKEFSRSKELLHVLNKTLEKFDEKNRHGKKLRSMLEEINCASNNAGLSKLLFRVRGRVHHFSNKSRKTVGTPFNQKEFETIVLIGGYISCLAIGYREVKINNS